MDDLGRSCCFASQPTCRSICLPSCFHNNTAHVETLILSENEIFGEIPQALGNLANLEVLDVGGNNLRGVIPERVCELPMAEITADCEEVSCTCCDFCCVDGDECEENQLPEETPAPMSATPMPVAPGPTQAPQTDVSINQPVLTIKYRNHIFTLLSKYTSFTI